MKITKIRQTPRGRIVVEFGTGDKLIATQAVLDDYALYEDMEITSEEYDKLVDDSGLSRVKERAARILGIRAHSRRELINKLLQKGEDSDYAELAADWLEELGILDDLEYGRAVVQRYAALGYGSYRIRNELYKRGVPREYWDEALDELEDQEDQVYELLYRKLRGESPDRDEKKRAVDYLRRRGFSWDEIKSAFDRYEEDDD